MTIERAVYGVCWCLLPVTPLCYVNPGPTVCDSDRLTMALDVALNSCHSYTGGAQESIRDETWCFPCSFDRSASNRAQHV